MSISRLEMSETLFSLRPQPAPARQQQRSRDDVYTLTSSLLPRALSRRILEIASVFNGDIFFREIVKDPVEISDRCEFDRDLFLFARPY